MSAFNLIDKVAYQMIPVNPNFSKTLYTFAIKILDIAQNKKEDTRKLFVNHNDYKQNIILRKKFYCALNIRDFSLSTELLTKIINNDFDETDKFRESEIIHLKKNYILTFKNLLKPLENSKIPQLLKDII